MLPWRRAARGLSTSPLRSRRRRPRAAPARPRPRAAPARPRRQATDRPRGRAAWAGGIVPAKHSEGLHRSGATAQALIAVVGSAPGYVTAGRGWLDLVRLRQ